MRRSLSLLGLIVLLACNSSTDVKTEVPISPGKTVSKPDCNVALKFINDYTRFIKSNQAAKGERNWLDSNSLLTVHFKTLYKNLLDSAQKADPEMGLDFDPVFDAQDFPDKGFELVNCDTTAGYVSVSGKEWKDFVLVLKVVLQDTAWLVDGSGVINIPVDKRAKR